MTSNSLGRYSEIGITTVQAYIDTVSSVNGANITLDNDYNYLSSAHDEGTFVVIESTASAEGKMEDIDSVTPGSNLVVLDSSIDGLEEGYHIAIIPKPLVYLCLESESLKETINQKLKELKEKGD